MVTKFIHPNEKKNIYILYYYTTKYKKLGQFVFQETHSILCFRITTPQYVVCAGGKVKRKAEKQLIRVLDFY